MKRFRHIYSNTTGKMMLMAGMLLVSMVSVAQEDKGVVVHGNVYGGGNLADVKGNTEVNICAEYDATNNKSVALSEGEGITVGGNVFGGGKGKADEFTCAKAMVGENNAGETIPNYANGTTTVRIGNGTIGTLEKGKLKEGTGDVYGGGEIGRVEMHTTVEIGCETGTSAPTIMGSVFGAGAGVETHGYSALVRGNSTVTVQGEAEVWQNVYGGGKRASVGRYYVAQTAADTAQYHVRVGMPCYLKADGKSTVNIQDGVKIGIVGTANSGDVFGAGQGVVPVYNDTIGSANRSKRMVFKTADHTDANQDYWDYYEDENGVQDTRYVWEYFATEADYLLYVETLGRSSETDVVIGGKRVDASTINTSSDAPIVRGTVYGGSESGFVYKNAVVNIQKGEIDGDVFGGGKGVLTYAEAGRVRRNISLTVNDGEIHGNVYGGGSLGDVGHITKPADYNYTWTQTDGTTPNIPENNKVTYTSNDAINTGVCTVLISGGTIGNSGTVSSDHGNVFGAGRGSSETWWCEKAMAFATNVTISAGTVYGNVYGGGQIGRVGDDTKVVIGVENASGDAAPTISGSVFGAGAGVETHGYSALVRGNSDVTVQGAAQVGGSVYGGGETASVGKFTVIGGLPKHPDSGGKCEVTIQDQAHIGASGTSHHVFGACKGVTPNYVADGQNRSKSMQLRTFAPANADLWSDYNNDPNSPFIWRYYASAEDYEAFLKTLALTSHPTVNISEQASVYGSVYGGGERGLTLGRVAVNITGGTVSKDVYGGGALADSNAGNWDADGFTEVTGLAEGASLKGLYTKTVVDDKDTYTEITDENATYVSGTYYSKGKWADDTKKTANYTTTVNLTGGLVKGDAYGGGLGQKIGFSSASEDIEATVWGDISVNLGDSTSGSPATAATAFEITKYTEQGYTDVIKSGRVFGCNNLMGSPRGNVTVTVWKTVSLNEQGAVKEKPDKDDTTYELAAVYGGGNLAPYETPGMKAHVNIHGCDLTSIQTVYGGGNAAAVPETQVDVYSCYEIGALFGGGNGKDKYKNDTEWKINPGANINGNANTMIYGGTVHEAYGGSNEKGTITGSVTIDVGENVGDETCTLNVGKLVGAGKNADVNGDLKIIMGCKPAQRIPLVFGGADNANVNGNVELTITSGHFGRVFGGNNDGGSIKGHIKLNIEETTCIPLIIDSLYLCGNNAAYSQYGYYVKTTQTEAGTGTGANTENAILTDAGRIQLIPRDSINDPHLPVNTYSYTTTNDEVSATWTTLPRTGDNPFEGYAAPVLNVTSCTRIGDVFGGGFGPRATVYGNPTVNINMTPGGHADEIDRDGDGTADGDNTLLGEIGNVYGGGDAAAVYGNTTVNIGTTTSTSVYQFALESGEWKLQYSGDNPVTLPKTVTGAYITGNVYGGGKLADVGKTHTVTEKVDGKDVTTDVVDIEGSTSVNICAVKGEEILDTQNKPTGRYNYTSVSFAAGAPGVTIGGSVYGGGKGQALASGAGAFRCSNAMVTKHTNVAICNGTIGDGTDGHGHVYGGGEKGRVQENTSVTIGCAADATSAPVIMGNVFGAGQGVSTHGYSALVRGNSYVTVQGNSKVKKSVYGGGEIASVGKYNVNAQGLPESLANQGSGYCTVVVRDSAVIGPDAAMLMTAAGGPDDYGHVFGAGKGVLPYEGYPDDSITWRTTPTNVKQNYLSKNQAINGTSESDYLTYVETLGLATQTYVTIMGNAFVKGSVYGGSENGYVQHDTQVNIQGNCQIGNGYVQMTNDGVYLDKLQTPETPMGVNRPYTATEWTQGKLIPDQTKEPALYALVHEKYYTSSLPECASWKYGQAAVAADKYASYDKYYGATGYNAYDGRTTADDGKTYYGNVFGGGSGLIPYRPGKWHPEAGSVAGNTVLNITGGHILTSIYGGNELTDVKGKCTVNFGGTATLGVPRTLKQIDAHPVTCYLFGAGKGDPRVLFNKTTNVEDVVVNITGGTIYGSVFGGGEDGHVLRDVKMTIGTQTTTGTGDQAVTTTSGPTIGFWGTSYVDGNVFGGGRGFSGEAYTAGNVAGSIRLEIKGGTMLGSIYGGGRLGSVGYGLFESTDITGNYGVVMDDDKDDKGTTTNYYMEGDVGLGRGHIDITISGGVIGNNREYIIPETGSGGNTPSSITETDFTKWTAAQWTTWKEYNNIPKTEFNTTTGRLYHTKGGNVYAGGMGNFYKQDGSTPITDVDWWKLGCVKSTKLTITGGIIKSTVFGGGELGQVVGYHTAANDTVKVGTELLVYGDSIGTELKESNDTTRFAYGSIYGGGYGSLMESLGTGNKISYPKYIAGRVKAGTKVTVMGGTVMNSVYGGGKMAAVGESVTLGETLTPGHTGDTHVIISDGTIGKAPIPLIGGGLRYFGGSSSGNVYGGGSGDNNTVRSGHIYGNTYVTISGGRIYHNVYGGGAYGTVGDFTYETREDPVTHTLKVFGVSGLNANHTNSGVATVNITGGTIGYDGKENGMVFGSSRGDINRPGERDDHTAWVYDTHVTIGAAAASTGPDIKGSVYGSGENGHTFNNTVVTVNGGKIGIDDSQDPGYSVTSNGTTYTGASYPYRGNVYGGGCGTDKYYSNHSMETHDGNGQLYNSLAGIVYGNATVNINGGTVVRNVYGAGAMGSVGKVETTNNVTSITSGGQTTVNISGGTVGVDATVGDGNVYGAARGDKNTTQTDCSLVKNTSVNISSTADVKNNVYGGGETGDVLGNTEVNVCAVEQTSGETVTYAVSTASGTPTIGGNVYGGGKGIANSFTCSKAMVGVEGDGVTITGTSPNETYTLKDGGTAVRIYNGTVGTLGNGKLKAGTGNVYGGGEVGRVERNTVVEIGAATGSSAPTIRGSVFAAGAGVDTHGYSALVRGHSTVTVQGGAQVLKNVYGGGEMASVGRYKVKISNGNPSDAPAELPSGMPYGLKAGGTSYVTIQGDAVIGTANDSTTGHVYGAGQGIEPIDYDYKTKQEFVGEGNAEDDYNIDDHYPKRMIGNNTWEYFTSEEAYHQFIETLAISASTDVTIDGSATVKGSVFGGSESGFVYRNTDVKIQGGTVHGDAFGGGLGLESFAEAGRVRWNTSLAVSGGAVNGNVYGGGKLGDVGTINKEASGYNYRWIRTGSNGNVNVTNNDNLPLNNSVSYAANETNINTGVCTVTVSGGEIGLSNTDKPKEHGNVFGAGKGLDNTFWCEKAMAFATNVTVSKGTVNGNVYGGGELGRVGDDTKVTIGSATESDALSITGSVFGAGAGLETHGYSALVRGNSDVIVQGRAQVGGSVYGGGETASVGKFSLDSNNQPKEPVSGGTCTVAVTGQVGIAGSVFGACRGVNPSASFTNGSHDFRCMKTYTSAEKHPTATKGTAWDYYEPDSTYVWEYFADKNAYLSFLKTLALTSNTHTTIGGTASVGGSVYGGGEQGITLGGTDVNIAGGTVSNEVYGGGALADTNYGMWDAENGVRKTFVELSSLIVGSPVTGYYSSQSVDDLITDPDAKAQSGIKYYAIYKTNVNLTGGTVNGSVYGGGLGQLAKDAVPGQAAQGTEGQEGYVPAVAEQPAVDSIPAKVYGDILVKLNEPTTSGGTTTYGNCVVKGKIFGCNNLNGSPQSAVTVHVYNTEDYTGHEKDTEKSNTKYNVEAVYGGGNLAAFIPDYKAVADTVVARVIIDGCERTSIGTVYGGGNAASVPATEVTVNGTYEIGEVFGGGNGKDDYELDGKWYDNPGANVGLKNYTHLGTGSGTQADPIPAENNTDPDASTKESRETNYGYGIGKAHATIYGGTVHKVYGGSNSRGNVRVESRTTLDDGGVCEPYTVDDAYGGGNNAPQDGDAVLEIGCISGLGKAYGGASNADVNGNVELTITNGTYGQVFGGNDLGGLIRGSIKVNIEETGCRPIIIGELYAGGNRARYSVYGYDESGDVLTSGSTRVADPQVNVYSFTSIGNIFGGGYGAGATMVGDPQVNIDVYEGKYADSISGSANVVAANHKVFGYPVPSHAQGAIGAINNVYGGGNEAEVIGSPTVNIGTHVGDSVYEAIPVAVGATVAHYYTLTAATGTAAANTAYYQKDGDVYKQATVATGATVTGYYTVQAATGTAVADTTYCQKKKVKGVDIRGNVYGGGNNAQVTGDTNVVVGKKK